jgi:hypothetical protein
MKQRVIAAFAALILLLFVCSAVESSLIDVRPSLHNVLVEPETGNCTDKFTYSVDCSYFEDANIKLEIYDTSNHTWEDCGTPERRNNKSLKWPDVTVCSGNYTGEVKFRFMYKGIFLSEHIGPTIVSSHPTTLEPTSSPTPEPIVSPTPTPTPMPYYSSRSRSSSGSRGVSKSTIEKIVKDVLEEEKFKGQLEEWKKQIGRSDKPLSKPTITCNVTPEAGLWFKPFRYNATINNSNRMNMSLGLFVYKPGSDTWAVVEYTPYRPNALILKNTTNFYNDENVAYITWESVEIFDDKDVNKSGYKYFIWYYDGYNEGEVHFTGPENVTENHEPSVTGSVTPEKGTFLTPFKYTAEIHDRNGDDTVYISLYVKDPSDRAVLIGEKTIMIRGGEGNATWVVPSNEYPERIFTAENMGNKSFYSSFYFQYRDDGMVIIGRDNNTSEISGPNVEPANVSFNNATVSPETGKYSDKFTYKAEFYTAESNTITATLRIYDPSNPSEYENFITKDVNDTGNIYILWQEVSPDVFGPDDFNKTGKYSIVWRDKRLQMKEKEEGPWDGPQINNGIPILGGVALPVTLIIVVPLVIPSMLFLSPFFRKKGVEIKGGRREEEKEKKEKEEEATK